jgi:hypothetical protein
VRGDAWPAPDADVDDRALVVIGFDGSYSRDATGIVGCTVEPVPHLFVIGCWEPDAGAARFMGSTDDRVPIAAVEQAVTGARRTLCGLWPGLSSRSLDMRSMMPRVPGRRARN